MQICIFFLQISIFLQLLQIFNLCFLPAGEVNPGGVGAHVSREPRPLREVVDLFWNVVESHFFGRIFIFFFYPVDDGVHAAVEDGGEVEDVLHNHWNLNDRTFSYMLKFKY